MQSSRTIKQQASLKAREWCIRIKVTENQEKEIKRKIVDSGLNIGEYARKKLLE